MIQKDGKLDKFIQEIIDKTDMLEVAYLFTDLTKVDENIYRISHHSIIDISTKTCRDLRSGQVVDLIEFIRRGVNGSYHELLKRLAIRAKIDIPADILSLLTEEEKNKDGSIATCVGLSTSTCVDLSPWGTFVINQ